MTMTQQLKPLECPKCDAAVPIGDGNTTKCPFCGGEVAVPAEYIALRDADEHQRKARAEAVVLLGQLAQPMPLAVRAFWILGTVATYATIGVAIYGLVVGFIVTFGSPPPHGALDLIFSLFVALIAVPMTWEWILHAVASTLHVDVLDKLTGFGGHALLGIVIAVFFVLPILLGQRAAKIRVLHDRLQAKFASRPPTRPGGPAQCRHCSAPLEVAPGALGARCLYCGTDNLLTVTKQVASSEQARAHASESELDNVVAERAALRAELIPDFKIVGILALLLMPMCGGVGRGVEALLAENDGDGTPHSTHAGGTPVLYGHGDHRPQGEVTLDCAPCSFYVPLHHGDKVTVSLTSKDAVAVKRRVVDPWYWLSWNWDTLAGPAPYSGWYRIDVDNEKPGATLHWKVN